MKKLVKTLLACGFASAIVATTAVGQPFFVTIDEQGNGSLTGVTPAPILFTGTIGVDPLSGMETLCYDLSAQNAALGVQLTTGDVLMFEQGATDPSDIVRFEQNVVAPGSSFIYFFSLIDDASEPADLADVDILPSPITPNVSLSEDGPEGNNGAQWRPTAAGQPGFVPQAPGVVIYNFKSDVVPEPSTLALFGLAGGLLALFWRQRSGRA
jgi:hypothetical protein